MRYSSEKKAKIKKHIIEKTAAKAKQTGFGTSGIDQLMAAANLSGSAFYNYFHSKNELLTAIVEHELTKSQKRLSTMPNSPEDVLKACQRYLTKAHVQNTTTGCMIPTLGIEVARADKALRKHAEDITQNIHTQWASSLQNPDLAWALLAQCVGAISLARMMENSTKQDEVLEANQKICAALIDLNKS